MTTLRVRVQSFEDTIAEVEQRVAAIDAGDAADAESTYTFPSWVDLHQTLAPKRIEIIRAMTGQGSLSIREIARRVGRDFKGVHTDIGLLLRSGVIDRTEKGVVFPYDRIHVEYDIEAAA